MKFVKGIATVILILAFLGSVGAAERGQISLGQAFIQMLVVAGIAEILLGGRRLIWRRK